MLKLPVEQCTPVQFKATDGGQLNCSEQVSGLRWRVQGLSDARILDLRCYDMIVGKDWLEAMSPVWVNYKTKEMRITHKNKRVILHGVKDQLTACAEVSPKLCKAC